VKFLDSHPFAKAAKGWGTQLWGTQLWAIFANNGTIEPNFPSGRSATMPTRNVNLTEELERFVLTKVESGRYENASEVVRAALRILEREEEQYEAKLVALRAAIDEGDASGIARGNVFARVRKTLKRPVARR
jgi:antitoxin ParD1/3/4